MNAEFTPNKNTLQNVGTFRHWCQKVLPLVYDDSLSYYELLCKVVNYLNETIENMSLLGEDVSNLHTAYVQLQGYVNGYFDTTDFEMLVNDKLDEMVEDGTLDELISQVIFNAYYCNIKDYGAVGDGVTDDTLAFVKCIKDAEENNKDILVPSGVYIVTMELKMSGIRIFGIRTKSVVVFDDTTGFVCGDNVTIQNLVVKGINGLRECVNVNGDNVVVESCEIIPEQIGISIYTCDNVIIDKCFIHPISVGGGNFGVWSNTDIPPTNVKITNCTICDFQVNAIFAHFNGCVIDSCYFRNNHLQVQPTGGGHLDIIGASNDELVRTVISNNIVTGGNSVTTGFEVDANRVLITGNYVYDIQGVGVAIQNRIGVHVIGNYFQNVETCIATSNGMSDFIVNGNYGEIIGTFIAFGTGNKRFAVTNNALNQVNRLHNLGEIPTGIIANNVPDNMNVSLAKVIQPNEVIPFISLDGVSSYIVTIYFGANVSKFGINASGGILLHSDVAQMISDTDIANKLYFFTEDNTVKIKNNIAGSVTMYAVLEKIVQ